MSLCPVVSSSRLSKHKVVGSKDLSVGSSPDTVHSARLQVQEDGSGDILVGAGFIVVHLNPLKLEVRGTLVVAIGVDAMLIRDDLPEL